MWTNYVVVLHNSVVTVLRKAVKSAASRTLPIKYLLVTVSCGVNGPNGERFVAQNSWWRAFDLDGDFGLSGTVNVAGIEVVITSISGPTFNDLQPVEFCITHC